MTSRADKPARQPVPRARLLVVAVLGVIQMAAVGAEQEAPVAELQVAATPPRTVAFDVVEKTIPEMQAAMEAGLVRSRDLVEAYLARVAAYDRHGPQISAILSLNPHALAVADTLDAERAAGRVRGPLHGIPILLKDNFGTTDMPTTAGSIALAAHVPSDDAFQVKKLRNAGAIILGKTNMHELSSGITTISSLGGQTKNPYDLSRNPGGSSGGTGAAVAASFAAAGMGSDTCGSIRFPSAHNNLVGLRGTMGLSSRSGLIPLSHTQDVGGPIARSIVDLAIMLAATVGVDPQDPVTLESEGKLPRSFRDALSKQGLRDKRIGLVRELLGVAQEDQEVAGIIRQAAGALEKLGAVVIELSIPELEQMLEGSSVIDREFKWDLMDYLARFPEVRVRSLSDILKAGLFHAALEPTMERRDAIESRDSPEYRKALERRVEVRRTVLDLFDLRQLTALAYPTVRRKAAPLGEPQRGNNCQLSAATGFPALSVPAGFTDDGLPVGIEFLGLPFTDAQLLALGSAFEQAADRRRAPFSAPSLVNGKAPAPVRFELAARESALDSNVRVHAALVYNQIRSRLEYQVEARGVPREQVLGGFVHRTSENSQGGFLLRVLSPGSLQESGSWTLAARDREDLAAGRLQLVLSLASEPPLTVQADIKLPASPSSPSDRSARR